jgi:hypothetical protein
VATGRATPYRPAMIVRRERVQPEDLDAALACRKGLLSKLIARNFRHFNAAALLDAAKAYDAHLGKGGKMLVAMAGAMSTAELGITLAEMIRRGSSSRAMPPSWLRWSSRGFSANRTR